MRATNTELNRSVYEYAIWQLIDMHNQEAIGQNDTKNIIHTSQARGLREKLDTLLKQNNLALETLPKDQFVSAVNQVYGKKIGAVPMGFDDNGSFMNFNDSFRDFMEITQFDKAKQLENGEYNLYAKNGYWPISPYDPRYANRGAVLNNGSHLGAISVLNDFEANKLNTIGTGMRAEFINNLSNNGMGYRGFSSDMPLLSKDDISGMSRLKLWMTDDEYKNVRDYVNDQIDLKHLNGQSLKTYKEMTDKAVYILRGLKQEGYNYKIEKDSRLGQIKARVENTKLDIRLTDTPENSDYIGRIYDTGMTGTYNATRKMATDTQYGNSYGNLYKINPTPEQALDLVNFALGNTVYVRDAQNKPSKLPVGRDVMAKRMIRGKMASYHTTYHPHGNLTAVSGPLMIDGKPDPYHNAVRMIFNTKSRQRSSTYMKDGDAAENYLKESIESARNNFKDRIDVDSLIKQAQEHKDDLDYSPDFDSDPLVSDIQQGVWDAVSAKEIEGQSVVILKPGVTQEDLNNFLSDPNGVDEDELDKYQYSLDMSPEEMAKMYVEDNANYYIGQFDEDQNGKRFDPSNVIKYQTSKYGMYRNSEDMTKALRKANIQANELKGKDDAIQNIANNLVKYDEASAKTMKDLQSPFMQSMYTAIKDSLENNGMQVNDSDIKIDKNGIVQYKGAIHDYEQDVGRGGKQHEARQITGQIGQIFEPDDLGVVYTNFAGGDNYAFIPGYTAEILPQKEGEDKSVEERTRLTGYKQQMIKNIKYSLRQDLLVKGENTAGNPTNINNTYRQIYASRKDPDFVKMYQEQGMPDHVLKAIIETEGQKVRYSNEIRDGSTINADFRAKQYGNDLANDNSLDPYNVTGNRNMSILTEESDGYFDPIASNATTTNQGIAKFLTSGAEVDDNGKIVPGPKTGPGSRTALMNIPEAEFMKYNPFDRQNMTLSNWLQADRVMSKVNVAQMTMGGWNQDDGVVISQNFAETAQIRDPLSNKMRPLKVGDKILDTNGNKGVVNLIVDPDMPKEEAEKQGISKEVAMFKANPTLDVAMAPFPAVSRYNGGTARQLMRNPQNLTDPETGKELSGVMGTMPMIITDKAADAKTKIYTEDDIKEGKGRKVSAQLAWSLDAKGATSILKEAYGRNGASLNNLREYMNVMGLDVDPYGNFKEHVDTQDLDNKKVIKQPDIVYTATGRVSYEATEKDLAKQLNKQGGLMEMPFNVKLANGQETNMVPVLSSYLRSGQELVDGTSVMHDYTHQYENMYKAGIEYRDSQKTIDELSQKASLDDKEQRKLSRAKEKIVDTQKKAQDAYNSISRSVNSRIFSGKHNIFRDKVMAHRMPKSATSIWTADPRLDIETIGMGKGMAEQMGLKDGDTTLVWRDPILRDGGVRSMKIKIDDRLTGVSINPSMDKSFDGDFDGDTVGIVKLNTKAAKKEAWEKFSVKNNLLDYGDKQADGTYPLYMQHSLDIMVAEHENPELNKTWKQITKDVNDFEKKYAQGEINKAQVDLARTRAVKTISDYYQDCYKEVHGKVPIKYDSMADHLESVKQACLDTGAKGSLGKFKDYAVWVGAKMTVDSKGNIDKSSIQDVGDTLATRKMQQDTMGATATKSFGTGVAGAYSQRAIKAMRNTMPKAALELTYPVTQAVLQIKHEPAEAAKIYSTLMGPARQLWNGYSMSKDGENWKVNRDANGKPQMATPDEWQKTFMKMYTEDLKVNPNPDYVKMIAKAMTNPQTNTMRSVEDENTISLMDKLAYGGDFNDVLDAAKNNQNLYEGKYNSQFAPDVLRDNIEIKKQQDLQKSNPELKQDENSDTMQKQVKSFGKSDTEKGNSRKVRRVIHVVRETVDVPKEESKQDHNDNDKLIADAPEEKSQTSGMEMH